MLFSSLIFLWVFLPIVFIGSFILQKLGGIKAANILLLISSLFFYAWGEPIYIFLMLASILINYSAGMLLCTKHKKVVLTVAVVLNLALLGCYKYAGMLVEAWNQLIGADVGIPKIALPIGISFFTFQALFYVIDAYRGDCEIQRNPLELALYVRILVKNGWLFYNGIQDGNPIACYKGEDRLIDEQLANIAATLVTSRDNLLKEGIEFVIFIAPNKERIYQEDMPSYTESRQSSMRRFRFTSI